jgi:hypothetical protein
VIITRGVADRVVGTCRSHRAELQNLEGAARQAATGLPKQDRTTTLQQDQKRDPAVTGPATSRMALASTMSRARLARLPRTCRAAEWSERRLRHPPHAWQGRGRERCRRAATRVHTPCLTGHSARRQSGLLRRAHTRISTPCTWSSRTGRPYQARRTAECISPRGETLHP